MQKRKSYSLDAVSNVTIKFQRRCDVKRQWIAIVLLMTAIIGGRAALSQQALPIEESLKKARVNGKYAMLLRQIKVPKDYDTYKEFNDLGLRDVKEYGDVKDLPKGHWVYVYPYWYIWRDVAATPKPKRSWGPEQVTGEPDTNEAGDIMTAWASLTEDDDDEWLLIEYAEPVVPNAVKIYETFNPGAVNKVSAFKLDGEEVEVWTGKDPTPVGSDKGVSIISFKADFKVNRVKIYLDSKGVEGWNEIDAVGLLDAAGKTQWATAVEASSTYAQQNVIVEVNPYEQRLARLEEEVRQLKAAIEELKKLVKKEK
jgi:hypothetical protein